MRVAHIFRGTSWKCETYTARHQRRTGGRDDGWCKNEKTWAAAAARIQVRRLMDSRRPNPLSVLQIYRPK